MTAELDLLTWLTVPAAVVAALWLLNGRLHLATMRNLFLLVAGYFALCVPVDLLFGWELRGGREYLADLNNSLFRDDVGRVFILYLMCIASFIGVYAALPWKVDLEFRVAEQQLATPSIAAVLGINVAALLLYWLVFGDLERMDRLLLARQSTFYKLLSLMVTFTQAFNLLYLLRNPDRKSGLVCVALMLINAFLTGSRFWGAAGALFFLIRHRVTLSRWQVAAGSVAFVAYAFVWKETTHLFWETGDIRLHWSDTVGFGLSRFEGVQSWVMAVEILHDAEPAWWFGWSYGVLPVQLSWPRFLLENPPLTLSEQYAIDLRPSLYDAGGGIGFSAIGEAWLNFGVAGPMLLGGIWAIAARWIDSRPRGLLCIIFFLMTVRLFRSDFASLFKSYFVMFGVALLLVACGLACLYLMQKQQNAGRVDSLRASQLESWRNWIRA